MGPGVATGGSFDLLQDEVACPPSHYRLLHTPSLADTRDALKELPVGRTQYQNAVVGIQCQKVGACAQDIKPSPATGIAFATDNHLSTASSDSQPAKAKLPWRTSRHRRPPVDWETFEPLDAVIEETSFAAEAEAPLPPESSSPVHEPQKQAAAQDTAWQPDHRLTSLDANYDVQEQIEKHLAADYHGLSGEGHGAAPSSESVVYGCNMLRHRRQWGSVEHCDTPADSYALLATPLRDFAILPSNMDQSRDRVCLASSQPPLYPDEPLKIPELMTVVEEVLSPSLSVTSDRSGSLAAGSARTSSFSVPRIEDSLEELDKLEDELEAVNAATLGRGLAPAEDKQAPTAPKTPSDRTPSTVLKKRTSVAGQSLTVRVKSCEKANPTIRRAASLTLRDKKSEQSDATAENKAAGVSSRDKGASLRVTTPKSAAKSQRPLTVPKFELPGDAVAKRLREQREARQARQAEAHSEAQANPPKLRVIRPLAKPTFELPGEAISRRKREDREAKLRAEEEEERRKREFKARPVRYSIGPATLPRETVTSRARQNRSSQEETEAKQAKAVRTPAGLRSSPSATPALNDKSLPTRGRNSMVLPPQHSSRAKSPSSGASGKRSTLSAEELEQQRLRGREIFARDSVLVKDRERDRRERESTAKLAREQAAERSRIASREWAEKKRVKEAAAREAAKQAKPAGVAQALVADA
ncbi:carboxylesterase family protein [Hirsutella rhossiliensis]|uniref:Carboxylesterase family protein n=1 Tax=Hirsutella rhossiliensis TaxID=111463 RepID=A0A9P8N3S9_9HYPO|nr:carboxylesterase family protein [Hirsutella rhossiliensis]KAH0966407.1 carboxylesterase family protein [Hirsutella rhossiliensis]